MTEQAALGLPTVTCPTCGRVVPDGEFCGSCGTHLVAGSPHAAHRFHAFAANPHEHMLHLNAVSTLFPHLPHRRSAPFRIALALVVIALVVLGYARLTGPSIAVAAFSVPLLYLLYLYEVEIYEDEPEFIIGSTIVLGLVLGFLWAHFTSNYVTQTMLLNSSPQGAPIGRALLTGVLFPLAVQLLMLAGAAVIYFTREYDEALDGFAFGAACAMGFVLSSTLVQLWPELSSGLYSVAPAETNVLRILERGLLIPFIYASTTGLIAGSLWLARGRTRTLPSLNWTTSVSIAILVAVAVQVGLGLVNIYVISQLRATLIYFVVAIVLLLWVRVTIHHCLLVEAVEVEIGPDSPCSHCHRVVPRMAFCPHCGVATRSAPKIGVGRAGRTHR